VLEPDVPLVDGLHVHGLDWKRSRTPIESWLKVLKSDNRAIFTAASQAQKAADWLVKRSAPAQVVEVAA
jgi:antirestriction protein ArdC